MFRIRWELAKFKQMLLMYIISIIHTFPLPDLIPYTTTPEDPVTFIPFSQNPRHKRRLYFSHLLNVKYFFGMLKCTLKNDQNA